MLNGIDKIEGLTAEQLVAINGLAQGLLDKNTDLLGKVNSGKEKASGTVAELERLRILEQGLEQ